ncbi:MAG: ZIP family zinc transporter [Solirubrobacterales bacterium]|nr:ZIP family zinc transporter [Solirubrobacterales bacterium]
MLEAALWGLVGGLALLLGAALVFIRPLEVRTNAYVMAFGAGVLISAVAFDLTEEAIELGGGAPATIGLAAGALTFFGGDWLLDRRGGGDRKRSGGQQSEGNPAAIALGSLLDGIPESAAIGLTLLEGGGVSLSFVVAVFLSNLPESVSATTGLLKAGRSRRWIAALWLSVAAAAAVSAMLGYELLGGGSNELAAGVKGFAGGAILCMLADTMMPEAFDEAGRKVGLVTVLGFALAALLSTA